MRKGSRKGCPIGTLDASSTCGRERIACKKKKAKQLASKFNTHNTFTHFPRSEDCEVCRNCKVSRAQCRQRHADDQPSPGTIPISQNFGEYVTADTEILNDDDASRDHDKNVTVIQCKSTYWLQGFPSTTKNTADTKKAFQRFWGPDVIAKLVYTDNAGEFIAALDELGIDHDTATPHRPETNGIAERAVRRIKEGSSCALVQSGWSDEWWPQAMACYCFLRNIIDKFIDGKT